MGGDTVTAAKEGDKIVLTDGAGNKATVVNADQKRSNGIVHEIDAVLSPAKSGWTAASAHWHAPIRSL